MMFQPCAAASRFYSQVTKYDVSFRFAAADRTADPPLQVQDQANRLAERGGHCYISGGRARERGGGTCERIDMGAPLGGHGRAVGRPGAPFTSTPERHDHAIHL